MTQLIKKPASTYYAGDSTRDNGNPSCSGTVFNYTYAASNQHSLKINMSFHDGHAASITPMEWGLIIRNVFKDANEGRYDGNMYYDVRTRTRLWL